MNNDDERDYEEEQHNRELMENPEGYERVELNGKTELIAGQASCPDITPHSAHVWTLQDDPYLCAGADDVDDGPQNWLYSGKPEVEWEKDLVGPIPFAKPAWVFVFGFGHKLYAYLPELHQEVQPQEGISLAGFYVKIHADDEEAARLEMIRRFGNNWSSTYPADSERGRLTVATYRELKGLQS